MQPITPFAPPTALTLTLPANVSSTEILSWLLALVVLYWIIYTIVGIFHWARYSHSPKVAVPAIGTHLFFSLVCIGYAVVNLYIL